MTFHIDIYKNNVYSDLFYDLLKKSSQYENFILKLVTAMSIKYEIMIKEPFIYQRLLRLLFLEVLLLWILKYHI